MAAREVPELAQKLVMRFRDIATLLAFRTAARGMAAEAQNQKEVLVKHGLVESVLDNLTQALDQFDEPWRPEEVAAGPTSAPARSSVRWRTRSSR